MSFNRLLLTAAMLLPVLATPALAVPVAEPLHTGIGNAGVTIPYAFSGRLGPSGIDVEATPTMLMVTAIAPGSPAAILDLPSPERYRVRLAAVNGRPVEEYELRDLQALFNPERESVTLTFGKRGPNDYAESFVGPYAVPLSSQAIAALQSRWLTSQRRFTEAHNFLADRQSETDGLADNMLLAARDLAAAGDYQQALLLVNKIGSENALYAEAQRLRVRWQLANVNAQLGKADALAAQGHFHQALALLAPVQGDDGWQRIKESRQAQWKSALAQREAYKSYKKTQQSHRASEAAAARRARQAELQRRQRTRTQVLASREYQRIQARRTVKDEKRKKRR